LIGPVQVLVKRRKKGTVCLLACAVATGLETPAVGAVSQVSGTALDDTLMGTPSVDLVDGGLGNDTIKLDRNGGDTLIGGPGRDRFVLQTHSGSKHVVADFKPELGDVLDLSAVDSNVAMVHAGAHWVPARPGIQPWKLVKTYSPRPDNSTRLLNGEATLAWLPVWNRTVVRLYRAGEDRMAYEIHVSGKHTGMAGFKGLVK
jgi:hypothetical protein